MDTLLAYKVRTNSGWTLGTAEHGSRSRKRARLARTVDERKPMHNFVIPAKAGIQRHYYS